MSLVIQIQTVKFGSFTNVDVEALGIGDAKLSVGYSHAARFSFTATAAAHTLPFTFKTFVRVYDPDGEVDGTSVAQSASNPLFEGFVEEVQPGGDTNEVRVVCYDPTYRSVRKVPLMNAPWTLDASNEPVASATGYPRVVMNVTQDNDADYAFSILQNGTIGQMLQRVLDDGNLPLYHINATPGNGTPGGYSVPYLLDELGEATSGSSAWVGGLDFEPQEKVVTHSESIRSFVDRLLGQFDPATKMVWQPGERLWRFIRVKDAPAVTITCNDPDAWHGMVNTLEIQRSVEGRYGAVKFVGPEGLEWRTAEWQSDSSAGDTLTPINQVLIGTSPNVGYSFNEFQIASWGTNRIANKGPYAIFVPGPGVLWANDSGTVATVMSAGVQMQTWYPSLQVRYALSDAGGVEWRSVSGARWDTRTGRIWLGDGSSLFRWNPSHPTNKFEEPKGIRFIYPALTEPLIVRVPETSYEGTAYTVGELAAEKVEYDESLAVNYEYGTPVTTIVRLAKFEKLATQILNATKDLIYAGGITLEGINYDFARLSRRVNIAAKNEDGGTLTTGWEAVGAIVSDVEYDFEEMTTTLQFSSDQMEAVGLDPELLRKRLKIRPATQYFYFSSVAAYSYERRFSFSSGWGWAQDGSYAITKSSEYLDEFGEVQ